jgi:hypothetical protein
MNTYEKNGAKQETMIRGICYAYHGDNVRGDEAEVEVQVTPLEPPPVLNKCRFVNSVSRIHACSSGEN